MPVLPPLLSVSLKLGIPEPLDVLSLRPAHLSVSSVTLTLACLLVTSEKQVPYSKPGSRSCLRCHR